MTTLKETNATVETPRADARMKRLESGALKREADTIEAMIEIYCKAHHGGKTDADGKKVLCDECQALADYAKKRLSCCPFGVDKPVCGKCKIHCYKPEQRQKICEVMRFSGPRILLAHPIMALEHTWKSLTVKAPEKPRNPKATKKA